MSTLAAALSVVAQEPICTEFPVGSPRWTECVEAGATGGGLMPWIVIIPLGVMVIGMAIGFAWQFSAAGQRRATAHGAGGTAGTWLIFVSFIEIAIGLGNLEAARRAPGSGGGYDMAAIVLLGVGALLFVIGVALKLKGRRRARIYRHGQQADARIIAVHETGVTINNRPMYAFELEVAGFGGPASRITHRESVPIYLLNRFGPGASVAVKVDPSDPTNIVFDWDRITTSPVPTGDQPASTDAAPSAGGFSSSPPGDPQFHTGQTAAGTDAYSALANTGRRVTRTVGILVALVFVAVIGIGLFVAASVFRNVNNVTKSVTDSVNDVFKGFELQSPGSGAPEGPGDRVSVRRPDANGNSVGYEVAIPVAWSDVTDSVNPNQGGVLVDLVIKPPPASMTKTRVVVTRSLRYLERPAPTSKTISHVLPAVRRELGKRIVSASRTRVDGVEAAVFNLRPDQQGIRARQVAILREGQLIYALLAAPRADFDRHLPRFEQFLDSWIWRR